MKSRELLEKINLLELRVRLRISEFSRNINNTPHKSKKFLLPPINKSSISYNDKFKCKSSSVGKSLKDLSIRELAEKEVKLYNKYEDIFSKLSNYKKIKIPKIKKSSSTISIVSSNDSEKNNLYTKESTRKSSYNEHSQSIMSSICQSSIKKSNASFSCKDIITPFKLEPTLTSQKRHSWNNNHANVDGLFVTGKCKENDGFTIGKKGTINYRNSIFRIKNMNNLIRNEPLSVVV